MGPKQEPLKHQPPRHQEPSTKDVVEQVEARLQEEMLEEERVLHHRLEELRLKANNERYEYYKDVGGKGLAVAGAVGAIAGLAYGLSKLLPEKTKEKPLGTKVLGTKLPTTQPPTTQPLTTQPLTAQPLTTEPLTTEPLTTEPLTTEPLTTEPSAAKPPGQGSLPLIPFLRREEDVQTRLETYCNFLADADAFNYARKRYLRHLALGGKPGVPMEQWIDDLPKHDQQLSVQKTTRFDTRDLIAASTTLVGVGGIGIAVDSRNQHQRNQAISDARVEELAKLLQTFVERQESNSSREAAVRTALSIATASVWLTNIVHSHQLLIYRKNRDPRIKIAILDTGIDTNHAELKGYLSGRTGAVKDFMNNQAGMSDEDGHGTNIAGVVARVADSALCYFGKVIERSGDTMDAEKLAWAINTAVVEWDVDIISLSVGYDDEEPQIVRDAIDNAVDNNVLVFAAAGNDPSKPPGFPARMERVIPIYAYSSRSNGPWESNARTRWTDYFCAPGEAVSPYDLRVHDGIEQQRSGTSQSTAFASATAACVLEFARQYKQDRDDDEDTADWPALDSEERMRLLRTPRGMGRILKLLSSTKSGPMYLEPWHEMCVPHGEDDADRSRMRFADKMIVALGNC
ncbi:hypothetical protein EG328_001174 [Venturia inaequalis]|uniref:Peptidase S8/S53 domain-containing protein n=1 Tax=Venturia inaequalis TaxID=5025 RepID=A0A8H3V0S8_VENIN|nr:hypothetical protein EG328_001174 [Venturia inaequalis]